MLHQLVLHVGRIGARLINLVDSDNNRHICILGMVDCLDGLRHNAIVSSYHQNGNICYLGTAGTHSSKSLMARSIQKDNLLALAFYLICTDMLGNAASLVACYRCLADNVQKGCLAVVNVSHNGNNRRTKYQ